MTTFATCVAGKPCRCYVTNATPYRPMLITGTGYGDAEPPEEEVFEFEILDLQGNRSHHLENMLTDADRDRIYQEWIGCIEVQNEPY